MRITPERCAPLGPDQAGCALCDASGENRTGLVPRFNQELCPRCGGYGYVPVMPGGNPPELTAQDLAYMGLQDESIPVAETHDSDWAAFEEAMQA